MIPEVPGMIEDEMITESVVGETITWEGIVEVVIATTIVAETVEDEVELEGAFMKAEMVASPTIAVDILMTDRHELIDANGVIENLLRTDSRDFEIGLARDHLLTVAIVLVVARRSHNAAVASSVAQLSDTMNTKVEV
jgi:hypothetical protein